MHNFDVQTVMEYMGPNSPASFPYAHSDLFSFNEADVSQEDVDDDDEGGPVIRRYPAVRERRHNVLDEIMKGDYLHKPTCTSLISSLVCHQQVEQTTADILGWVGGSSF